MSCGGGAELASPRAAVTENHKGGGSATPAFRFVGALALLTDGMQPARLNERVDIGGCPVSDKAGTQPFGFANDMHVYTIDNE